jgi:hypothetical protein
MAFALLDTNAFNYYSCLGGFDGGKQIYIHVEKCQFPLHGTEVDFELGFEYLFQS